MRRRSQRTVALAFAVGVAMAIAGCSSSSTPTPTAAASTAGRPAPAAPIGAPSAAAAPRGLAASAAPLPSQATTSSADRCPTAVTVGAALGISLSKPSRVPNSGGTPLPPGATGVACDYRGTASNVLIELIANISPSAISLFTARFPVPPVNVSGVGDQARSFSQPLNGGKDNEGVVATKGTALVMIIATATPASLTQVETLVSQLL